MASDFLLELGTEEIPAAFLQGVFPRLAANLEALLKAARLEHGGVRALATPRRIGLIVSALSERQSDVLETLVGPPAQVAFDAAGKPTKAAEGFARKNGVPLGELQRREVEGKKGEYVVALRSLTGAPTRDVLPALLGEFVRGLPWPKSMRWAYREDSFARPLHWLVAVLGSEVLPFELFGVRAGRQSRGHRFLAPGSIEVDAGQYEARLREAFVIVDPAERRGAIERELARIERETGARVNPDAELLSEVTFLVEYPVGVTGQFDALFLKLPSEVIISAMRSHQRYFAMLGEGGVLIGRFITIAGTATRDAATVRRGNERVLAARLTDAKFFFSEDRKRSLDAMAKQLDDVVFIKQLGTIGAKVRRIGKLAERLALAVSVDVKLAARATALCKADLVSSMVYEFPELQGSMGRHYAQLAGEPSEVADAIRDHYVPRGAGDDQTPGLLGAVVGIADRVDTLVGCFLVGLQPTGSVDPYGLRRVALGILSVLLRCKLSIGLDVLIGWAAEGLREAAEVSQEKPAEVLEFLRIRLRGLLTLERGLPSDSVDAALGAGYFDVPDALARVEAVAGLRERADFEPLAATFKRVANILERGRLGAEPVPARFVAAAEHALWERFLQIRQRADALLEQSDYAGALKVLSELKAPVDAFFDAVLVMDEDVNVRNNRLALLGQIDAAFARIADFKKLGGAAKG